MSVLLSYSYPEREGFALIVTQYTTSRHVRKMAELRGSRFKEILGGEGVFLRETAMPEEHRYPGN